MENVSTNHTQLIDKRTCNNASRSRYTYIRTSRTQRADLHRENGLYYLHLRQSNGAKKKKKRCLFFYSFEYGDDVLFIEFFSFFLSK